MDKKVLDFLNKERVCALTVILPDGIPHSATMHFSLTEEPLRIIFSTDNASKKYEALKDGYAKASVLIGFSEEEWITFQAEGELKELIGEEEIKKAKEIHYAKIPSSKEFENEPGTIFLEFSPSFWKYTDFNSKPPFTISSS